MTKLQCPFCTADDILVASNNYECLTCGHEWEKIIEEDQILGAQERLVKDAYGNILTNGDIVAMIKDIKLKGSSKVLKSGMKSKAIRLVDGDHEIDCKMDGMSIALKACFVKKVL